MKSQGLQLALHRHRFTHATTRGADEPATWAPFITIAALICVAVALGGGGARYALLNLAVQLAGLIVLGLRYEAVSDFWRSSPRVLIGLVTATIMLPLVQLVPLPEALWTNLPGRELLQQSFDLTGRIGWASISVDPVRTTVALMGLIVPVAILIAGWALPNWQLPLLGWLMVCLGLVNFVIGVPQVLSNGTAAVLFDELGQSSLLNGTFANRNSTGVMLVGALAFAAVLPSPSRHPAALVARLCICLLLVVGIVLTRSRTALVLTAIPLVLAVARAYWWSRKEKPSTARRAGLVFASALAIGAVSITSAVIVAPGRVGDTIERFQSLNDARGYIWEDSAFAASRYWPVGAGMGTFDEVFQVDESLENSTQRRPGRAHNDYLEIAIEAGFAGIVIVALWAAVLAWFVWKARHSQLRWTAWAAASFLLAIALQSITDYPLRNQSLLALASLAVLILAKASVADKAKPQ